ncbi:alpha/beta hydrolase [Achromobacter mucicolens]|uniref:alpha/beta fold hydrolase n=1 Tax=Achromobacter mucicolens TaxID=1389922 RepID=UPI002448F4E3|nr:alpha/beta hydrolase [Achromobacter mucicolens]MDH0091682.1 alpha/beta hydrolase [Achromobacter mucicolens]
MTAATEAVTVFAEVHARGRPLRLECRWISPQRTDAPLIVFLHEGLGSVSMWKDWPAQVCEAAGCRGLVYSRYGYGQSTARPQHEAWPVDFMHQEAHDVLPALLEGLGVNAHRDRPVLFGHSDGGSIALLYAARYPEAIAGVIAAAPHILVEDVSITSIAAARRAYLGSDLRARLSRHHQDVDSAFWGWNDIWLNPEFRAWTIEDDLHRIACPVLAIQGMDDEYGTLEQVRGIRRRAPHTELLEIPDCGHSPHRDQPATVVQAAARFVGALEKPG